MSEHMQFIYCLSTVVYTVISVTCLITLLNMLANNFFFVFFPKLYYKALHSPERPQRYYVTKVALLIVHIFAKKYFNFGISRSLCKSVGRPRHQQLSIVFILNPAKCPT